MASQAAVWMVYQDGAICAQCEGSGGAGGRYQVSFLAESVAPRLGNLICVPLLPGPLAQEHSPSLAHSHRLLNGPLGSGQFTCRQWAGGLGRGQLHPCYSAGNYRSWVLQPLE